MKLNLLRNFDPNNCLTGYVNLCNNAPPNNEECKQSDLINLDPFCCDAEATEIFADDLIDYLNPQAIHMIFDSWIKKLGHGGKLVVTGIETYSVCKAANLRAIDIGNLNLLLRGSIDNPFMAKKFTYNIEDIVGLMKSKGLKVVKASINDLRYCVVGERD